MKSAFLQKGITKAEQSMAKQLADSKGGNKPDFDYDNPNVYLKSHDATPEADKKKGIKRTKTVEALQPMETSFTSSGSAGSKHRTDSQLEKSRYEYEVPIPKGEEGHEWSGSKEIIITAPKIGERKKTTLVKQSNRSDGDYTQLPESRVSINRDNRGNVVRGGKPMHDFYKGPTMKGSPAKQGLLVRMEDFVPQKFDDVNYPQQEKPSAPKHEVKHEALDYKGRRAKRKEARKIKRTARKIAREVKKSAPDKMKGSPAKQPGVAITRKKVYDTIHDPKAGSPAKQGIGHLEKMTDRINRDKAKGKGKK